MPLPTYGNQDIQRGAGIPRHLHGQQGWPIAELRSLGGRIVADQLQHWSDGSDDGGDTGNWHSVCLCSDGSYGVPAGLINSFPVRSDGRRLDIVQGLPVNDFSRAKIDATVKELHEEKALVGELAGG